MCDIKCFRLDKRLRDISSSGGNQNIVNYNNLLKISHRISKHFNGRVLITLTDGTVVIDTKQTNTYEKF